LTHRIRKTLSLSILAVLCIAAVFYVRAHWAEFRAVELRSPGCLAIVALGFLANMGFRGLFSYYVLRALNVRLSFPEAFQLSAVTTMANFLLPLRSGAGLRALYLNRLHRLELTLFASTMTALYILFIFVNCLLGMVALTAITGLSDALSLKLFALLAAPCLAAGWAIFLAPPVPQGRGKLRMYLSRIGGGWDQIRGSRPILLAAMLTTAGTSACASLSLYAGFHAFGLSIDLSGSVLLMASQNVGGLIGLTPGAAGFQEAAGLLFSVVLSVTVVETLLVLGTTRFVKVGVALAAGLPSFALLSKRMEAGAAAEKDP